MPWRGSTRPFVRDGFMIHAECDLPGLRSQIASRFDGGRLKIFHTIRDELTDSIEDPELGDYQVKHMTDGRYMVCISRRESDLAEFRKRHLAALQLWHDLAYVEGESVEQSKLHWTDNHARYHGEV